MDSQTVETFLRTARLAGEAQMRPCSLVTPAVRSMAAQRVGIAHLFLRPRFVLADPTGCGKTPMALVAYAYLREKDPNLRALVVTTRSAQFQWKARAEEFLQGVSARVVGYGPGRVKLKPADRLAAYPLSDDLLITTYATLTLDEQPLLNSLDRYVLILDEAHKVNNFRTAKKKRADGTIGEHQYISAQRASHKARCVWALTATPMKNDRLDELYSIFEIVRPGTFGGYSEFRRNYYVLKLVKPRWTDKKTGQKAKPFYEILGTQNLNHLRATIDPFYLRRPPSDFGDLPEITFEVVEVELEKKQRALYDSVIKQRWPGATDKIHQLAAVQFAQQILGAPETVGFPDVPSAKATELIDRLAARPDDKVLVYTKFVGVADYLGRRLQKAGILYGRVTGEESTNQRETARLRFQTDPTFNVMLITDAGGEALDLQAARSIVFYDLPWSYGNFTQVLGRARRLGSTQANVLAVLLGATNTIDQTIGTILTRKETTIRDIIRQGNTTNDITIENTINKSDSDIIDLLFRETESPGKRIP